jgi:hypothetical protein
MGIYYAVINYTKKEYIYDPADAGVKWGAIFHPEHPMGRLILLQIYGPWAGDEIQLVDDVYGFIFDNDAGWKDITKAVVEKWIEAFPDYRQAE